MTTDTTSEWRIVPRAARYGSPADVAAVAPGCPAGPHPHRHCACQFFPTRLEAAEYASEQELAQSQNTPETAQRKEEHA